ncbi:hypothetical protein [Rheinheimera baltica]|nr:hypothetical protein [Rheinheimera baltica]
MANKRQHTAPAALDETSPNKVDAYQNDEVGKKWLRYSVIRGL